MHILLRHENITSTHGIDDANWVTNYAQTVLEAYGAIFAANAARFAQSRQLLDRFQVAICNVLQRSRADFHSVDEAHNELCIAGAILANLKPQFSTLSYEPPLPNTPASIDFRAETADASVVFVDVKTVRSTLPPCAFNRPAAEPPRAAPNCSAARQPHFAPSDARSVAAATVPQ